jgi:hypothetical protein
MARATGSAMGKLIVINGATERQRLKHEYERVCERSREYHEQLAEAEREFVENDLVVTAGPRQGQPLTTKGRRQRLSRLFALRDLATRTRDEAIEMKMRIEGFAMEERLKTIVQPEDEDPLGA